MRIKDRKALQRETVLILFIYNEAISGNNEALLKMNRISEILQQIDNLKNRNRNRDPFWREHLYCQKETYQELRSLEIQKKYLLNTADIQKWKARKYLSELKQKSKRELNQKPQ